LVGGNPARVFPRRTLYAPPQAFLAIAEFQASPPSQTALLAILSMFQLVGFGGSGLEACDDLQRHQQHHC
jgi:hypothetical protein